MLKRVRDFAQVNQMAKSTERCRQSVNLQVDHQGLDYVDQKLLKTMIDLYGGGPVGLSTLSVNIGEETETVEDMYEPYLIQKVSLNEHHEDELQRHLRMHFGYDYLEGRKIKGLNKRRAFNRIEYVEGLIFIFQSLCNGINILF